MQQIAGATVVNVPLIIRGTQDKKEFTKKINVDFYFVLNTESRNGNIVDTNVNYFEIMGVNISSDKNELNGFNYHFNTQNALKDFKIQ